MASAGSVTVDFVAETAKFHAELKQVNSRLKDMESGFNSVATIAKASLAALSVSTITSFAKAAFDAADAMGDTAAKFGVAAETLSRLNYAAQQNDVEFASLTIGIKTLQKGLSEATNGSVEAQKRFTQLGLSASELKQLSLDQQFTSLAEAFKNIKNPADQTRIAMELFGKSGADLVPLLNSGADGITSLMRRSDELGITLKTSTSIAIDAADKALKEFGATAKAAAAEIAGGMALMVISTDDPIAKLALKIESLKKSRNAILEKEGRLGISFKADLDAANGEIAALEKRLEEIQRLKGGASSLSGGPKSRNPQIEIRDDTLTNFFSDSDKIIAAAQTSMVEKMRALDGSLLQMETELYDTIAMQDANSYFDRLANATKYRQQMDSIMSGVADDSIAATNRFVVADLDAFTKSTNEKMTAEFQAAQQKQELQASALAYGTEALQVFAGRSKAAAIAMVAINKTAAIAKAIQNTHEGATTGLAQGGIWGYVQMAAILAAGWAEVNAIKATNYGSTGISSGSSSSLLGTSVNSVFSGDTTSSATQGATSQKVVNININGSILSSTETAQWLIDTLTEAVQDRDVVFMSSTSRQAQELISP